MSRIPPNAGGMSFNSGSPVIPAGYNDLQSLKPSQILGENGQPLKLDEYDPGMPISHIFTFTSLLRGASRTYFRERFDEAMRHSRENALHMRLDEHLGACLNERIRATTSLRWHIAAPDHNDPWQKAAAEGTERVIRSIHRLRRLKKQSMQALWFGRYGNQVQWQWKGMKLPMPSANGHGGQEQEVRALTVLRHLPVNGDKISYTWDHTPTVRIYQAHAGDYPKGDVVLDNLGFSLVLGPKYRDKFIIHTYNPDDADFFDAFAGDAVHGLGIRSWLYWSWWTKQEYITAVVDALERFGLGFVCIKFDMSNDQARQEAEKVAKNYSRRSIFLIPTDPTAMKSGNTVEIIETPTAGMTVQLELQRACEKREERFIVAQSLSSDHRGSFGLGGSGAAAFQKETKWDVIEEDSNDLAETLTGNELEPGLVSMIQKYTYPWADFPLRFVFDTEPNEATQKLANIATAYGMGSKIGAKYVDELIGVPPPSDDEPVLQDPQIIAAQLQTQMMQQQMQGQPIEQPGQDDVFNQLLEGEQGAGNQEQIPE
jgi:phage gp29-like protein